jgi:hypothetical protein
VHRFREEPAQVGWFTTTLMLAPTVAAMRASTASFGRTWLATKTKSTFV